MKDIEITQELIDKWKRIGFLDNVKNINNLVFALEYNLQYNINRNDILNKDMFESNIFPIIYRIFRNISIDLPQDFIIKKINSIILDFDNEYTNFKNLGLRFMTALDSEMAFNLQFSRKHHFNIIL